MRARPATIVLGLWSARGRWAGAGAAIVSLAVAAWALKLWRADLQVPFRYSAQDDTMFYLSLIKGIIDHGWFLTNHSLGAPFGQQLFDYPQSADNLNYLVIKGLAVISPHVGFVINAFFLLTFPIDAAVAYAVMRRVGVSKPSSFVCAVLFALLPYHFFRSDSHLVLSAYYAVPLAAYLFLRVVGGEQLFARRPSPTRPLLTWATGRTVATVLICVVIASTGLYYAVFGLVALVAGVLLALLARRDRRAVLGGAVACALVAATLAINLAPTIVYQLGHGANPQVTRSANEGDDLALSVSYLLLPPEHNRIGALRSLTGRYAATTAPHGYCEQCYESIGTVGDVGFLWLAVVALGACIGAPFVRRRSSVYRSAGVGVAVCLALGITGGISSLTRVFVSSDVRAWNRLSVLIAFFSLLAVGLLLDALRRRLRSGRGQLGFTAILVATLLFGIADQTSSYFVPPYAADAREYRSDAQFVQQIQRTLPRGSAILNLPYVPFPEGYQPYSVPGQTIPYSPSLNFEYEPARGYVHSEGLRWSYGAMKGRPADWQSQLAAKPVDLAVAGAAAAGFRGLVVDPRGYPGPLGAALVSTLRSTLRVAPELSPDNDLLFYDLRPYAQRLGSAYTSEQLDALRTAVLTPLRMSCSRGRLTILNPTAHARPAALEATVLSSQRVVVRLGVGRGLEQIPVAAGRRHTITEPMLLAPGRTTVAISAGDASAALLTPTIVDDAFAPFARGAGSGLRTGVVGPPCATVVI